ncbi:lycopene cyclase domain-containing protein [uncultured Leifsonia sp.]|uniref:lycopene cyclase domain-containing protein n=1 Tax=uncultured Leifsonia sp. TaxID=340359 RepID=UPI0025F9E45C|nr:lycopene cyclase domain-containing protein [uncultured Leifsonia sp.]
MSLAYLVCLLAASGALVLLDSRFRLVFWRDARRAAVVLVVALAFFLAWDAVGIVAGVFARGRSPFMTGIELAPELPLEEPVFLAFLCYLTLILLFGGRAVLDRVTARRREPSELVGHDGRRR